MIICSRAYLLLTSATVIYFLVLVLHPALLSSSGVRILFPQGQDHSSLHNITGSQPDRTGFFSFAQTVSSSSQPSTTTFPAGRIRPGPRIQHRFGVFSLWGSLLRVAPDQTEAGLVRYEVERTFIRAWQGYKDHAWGHDEVAPIFGGYRDEWGGWAVTAIAALDTLWIMGRIEEFDRATKEVAKVNFTDGLLVDVPLSKAASQILGGLIGAFDASNGEYPILLDQARRVGDILLKAFDTPNGMPTKYVSAWASSPKAVFNATQMPLGELAACGLEFLRLSQLTGDSKYHHAITRVNIALQLFQTKTSVPGLWPDLIDASACTTASTSFDTACKALLRSSNGTIYHRFTLSHGTQPVIASLLKQRLLLGTSDRRSEKMYRYASSTIKNRLIFTPIAGNNAPSMEMVGQMIAHKTTRSDFADHTTFEAQFSRSSCSVGASFALSSQALGTRDLPVAKKLAEACIWSAETSRSGIMPERIVMMQCRDLNSCEGWSEDREHRWWDELDLRLHEGYSAGQYHQLTELSYGGPHFRADESDDEHPTRPYDALLSRSVWRPEAQLSHEDFARDRIWHEGLAEGMLDVRGRAYTLRADATLESLLALYRITGDERWREEGARVFRAIDRATAGRHGNAALLDATAHPDRRRLRDEMHPAWLSATLKYAYLLFSEPRRVSLDDFVFNSQGHPFKLHTKARTEPRPGS